MRFSFALLIVIVNDKVVLCTLTMAHYEKGGRNLGVRAG